MDRTILLVEDNPDDVELTLRAFRVNKLANPVGIARDGVEALDFLFGRGAFAARAGHPPALVILDLKLPRLDGHEVLKAMRADARLRRVPVVVLTSSREEEDVAKSYSLGANSVVRKPVDYAAFVEAARTLGMYWMMLNEPPPQKDPA